MQPAEAPAEEKVDVTVEPAEGVEPVVAPTPEPDDPALLEHKAKQKAYQEWMAKMTAQSVAEAKAPEPEPTPEESAEDLAALKEAQEQLERETWLQEYADALEADRAAGVAVYVVGNRPPRPRWHGVQLGIGDVVPGAHAFPRIDTWVSTGVLALKQTALV